MEAKPDSGLLDCVALLGSLFLMDKVEFTSHLKNSSPRLNSDALWKLRNRLGNDVLTACHCSSARSTGAEKDERT